MALQGVELEPVRRLHILGLQDMLRASASRAGKPDRFLIGV
jgi:hypothetical protein